MNKSFQLPALAAVFAFAAACGGDDLVLPSEGEPASIVVVQGDGQSGRVGEALPQPLVMQVADVNGRPVAGATVAVELDGAEVRPDTTQTEDDGLATVGVVLGPTVGTSAGTARVLTPAGQQPVEAAFTVSAVAASANGLVLESGDGQAAPAGTALAEPLVVRVTDAFGNPIPGVTITWTAVNGGSVSEASTISGGDGRTSVIRTLGTAAGLQTTTAASDGLAGSPVTFIHTATPGSASGVTIVSGNGQSGAPGSALAQPLVVKVADADGNPISGAAVSWIVTGGGGSLAPSTSSTDAGGLASSVWTLGSSPGSNTAEAVVSGVGQASFTATALAGAPGKLRIVSGNGQTGEVGQRLGADLVVAVLDARDNPVPGATVTWQVRSGGGSVAPATATSDANGRVATQWTLGPAPGANTVEASVPGASPVTFEATGTAGSASRLALSTQPSAGAQAGIPFGRQPVVQLRDAAGNDVALGGVSVTAAIASGGGSLGGTATRATDGNGRATFTDLEINGAVGDHALIFAANGFTSVTSSTIAVGPAATTTAITADDPDPSEPGATVTVNFTVTSDAGTPTGTVTVTASGGDETCSADVAQGSCQLALTAEGSRTLTASYGGAALFAPSDDTESHEVAASNSSPTAVGDAFAAPATPDRALSVDAPGVLGNDQDADGDPLQAALVTGVDSGTLSLNSDGSFSYTPDPGFPGGEVSFTYRAQDPTDSSDPATVVISVPAPQ